MVLWRLKKREQITIHQTRPLVFRRIDDHWALTDSEDNDKHTGVSFIDEEEDQLEYS